MDKIPIFIVNLKKDTEKKKHMQQLCRQYSLECKFINATYGKELDDVELGKVYNKKRALKELGRELTYGEIGCALSHKKIYQKIVNENIENAIIFEDDIIFDNSIHELLGSLKNFPIDWECTLLCYYRIYPTLKRYCTNLRDRVPVSKHLKIVRFIDLMHSTAAYAINFKGAKKLLNELESGIYKPIDHYTGDEKHVNLYGVYPKIIDIDPTIGLNSSIATERNEIRSEMGQPGTKSSTDTKSNGFHSLLKKIGLYEKLKKINEFRYRVAYYLNNLGKCLTKPKKYQ